MKRSPSRWLRLLGLVLLGAVLAFPLRSLADYVIVDGNGAFQVIFSFVCQTTKICPAQVLIDSNGVEHNQANPLRVALGNASATAVSNGTVAVAGVFQSVLSANPARNGCLFQNQSDNVLYVFFGANGSATQATSIFVGPWSSRSCQLSPGGMIATDNVSVTGPAGSAFVILSQ